MAASWRARSARGGRCSSRATTSSWSLALSQASWASSTSGSTGPAVSQSMRAAGSPSRATMFQGATSQWPNTLTALPRSRPCQGNHTAPGGGRNEPVAWCRSRSMRPTAAAPSRLQGPGWVNSPSMNVSTSRPSVSRPDPTTRGAAAKPASSRWRSSACTVGVHGPASLITTSPRRWTTDRPPPESGTRSSAEVTIHCRPRLRRAVPAERAACTRPLQVTQAWLADHAGDLEVGVPRQQAEPLHRTHHALEPHRVDAEREGREGDERRGLLIDMQVLPDDVLHRRAVGVGDLLPLGQCRGERLQRVGVLLGPFRCDCVALDREVLGSALVEVGEFLQAFGRLAAADE